MGGIRKVRVLINPKSGTLWSAESMLQALQRHWDVAGVDLTFQFSKSAEDGTDKTRRAVEEGVDSMLIIGGDGMVNSIGAALVGTGVALGVIPAGSGNGFARHFGIPLNPERAARALKRAERKTIDVGTANGRPFFVTCSLAWDAALVRSFDKSPVRGVLPYVFAAAYEFLDYSPQPFQVTIDGERKMRFSNPLVFTMANLTQFGGGARIAPDACPDDGAMELVVIPRLEIPYLLANVNRLFNGTINKIPDVVSKKFKRLEVHRQSPAPMQMDGELVEAGTDVSIEIMPRALTVLVPEDVKVLEARG